MPRVLLTRAAEDNRTLAAALSRLEIDSVGLPTPSLKPVPPVHVAAVWQAWVDSADAIAFTSRYAIRSLKQLGLLAPVVAHPFVAVVGEKTAAELAKYGCAARIIADPANGAALAEALSESLPDGSTVLCPQARHARPELAEGLLVGDLNPRVVVCYENVRPPRPQPAALAAACAVDAVYLAAPSAADRLYAWLPELVAVPWIAIGPTTAAAVTARHGHAPVAVAQTPGLADVVAAIEAAVIAGAAHLEDPDD